MSAKERATMRCTCQVKTTPTPLILKGFHNSPSEEEEEDSDMDGLKSDTNEDSDNEKNVESPIRSVIGPNGLRKFVLPLMWTVNNFNSTIKKKHFDTLRERY